MPFEPAIQLHLKMSYSLSLRWSRGLSSHYTQQKWWSGYCEAVWQVDCGEVEWWSLLNSSSLRVDGLSNLCQVDGQMNVGETQMNKFSSKSACQVNFDRSSKFVETNPKGFSRFGQQHFSDCSWNRHSCSPCIFAAHVYLQSSDKNITK